jgi:hypothetical protein
VVPEELTKFHYCLAPCPRGGQQGNVPCLIALPRGHRLWK